MLVCHLRCLCYINVWTNYITEYLFEMQLRPVEYATKQQNEQQNDIFMQTELRRSMNRVTTTSILSV